MRYLGLPCFLLILGQINCNIEISQGLVKKSLEFAGLIAECESSNEAIQSKMIAKTNAFFDVFIEHLALWVAMNGYDPLKLPDLEKSFSKKIILFIIHGDIKFGRGWLKNLTTLNRYKDTTVKCEENGIQLGVPLSFSRLSFVYDYNARFMSRGPTGQLHGSFEPVEIYLKVLLNLVGTELSLTDFVIESVGKINLRWQGNSYLDWFMNLITKILVPFIKKNIIIHMENNLKLVIRNRLGEINKGIYNYLV